MIVSGFLISLPALLLAWLVALVALTALLVGNNKPSTTDKSMLTVNLFCIRA
jgi:hypothetical protein